MEFASDKMVDPQLLDILVCPETKQPLRLADADLIERVNASIRAGHVRNRAGRGVAEPIDEALVREAGDLLYPIREDIPIMLIDEAIPLPAEP